MEEYQAHIRRTTNYKESYCGKKLQSIEWAFTDPTHAIAAIDSGSRLQICPDCKKKLIEILNKSE